MLDSNLPRSVGFGSLAGIGFSIVPLRFRSTRRQPMLNAFSRAGSGPLAAPLGLHVSSPSVKRMTLTGRHAGNGSTAPVLLKLMYGLGRPAVRMLSAR